MKPGKRGKLKRLCKSKRVGSMRGSNSLEGLESLDRLCKSEGLGSLESLESLDAWKAWKATAKATATAAGGRGMSSCGGSWK